MPGTFACCSALPPITSRGALAGIKIPQPRFIRLLDAAPWRQPSRRLDGKQIHHAVLTTFHLSTALRPQPLRYDLSKLKGHGLLQRDGSRTLPSHPQGGSRLAALSFFTNGGAARSPRAAYTNRPTPSTSRPQARAATTVRQAIKQIVEARRLICSP